MQKIPQEYILLFNVITDVAEGLQSLREQLLAAQQLAEELYIHEDGRYGNAELSV